MGPDGDVPGAVAQNLWRTNGIHRAKHQRHLQILMQCIVDILHQFHDSLRAGAVRNRTRPDGRNAAITTETSASWAWIGGERHTWHAGDAADARVSISQIDENEQCGPQLHPINRSTMEPTLP